MLSKPDIKKLINRHQLDAKVLFSNRRYAGSIYLQGYAVELALKYSVCLLLKFGAGYPETETEFNRYAKSSKRFLGTTIKKARDLKIHELDDLLFFSGRQLSIQTRFPAEWNIARTWDSVQRYNAAIVRRAAADQYLTAARRIIAQLT